MSRGILRIVAVGALAISVASGLTAPALASAAKQARPTASTSTPTAAQAITLSGRLRTHLPTLPTLPSL